MGMEIGLQRAVRAGGAAAGFESPLGQVAGHVERRGIVAARREIAAFELVGGQKIVVDLQLFFADGVRIPVAGSALDFGRLGLALAFGLRLCGRLCAPTTESPANVSAQATAHVTTIRRICPSK